MTRELPIRAEADGRILDEYQNGLFDEPEAPQAQLLADYRQRYGLAEDPFAEDYSFPMFTGAGRRQVLDRLLHQCQFSNSLLLVLGDYGVGKTRVAHGFMDSLSERDHLSYLPLKAGQTTSELLLGIGEDLELGGGSEASVLASLEQLMHADVHEGDGLAVVVIDNAHLLSLDSLQVICDLLVRNPQQTALHFVLLGEPSLMSQLERCQPESLLVNDFYLQPFTLAETVDYLNFRMEMADYLGPEIFTEAVVNPWWRQAQGQLSMVHQYAQQRLLESVSRPAAAAPLLVARNLPIVHILAIAALLALVALVFLYMDKDEPEAQAQPAASISLPTPASAAARQDLTRTDTPVQPIMQSLPGTAATPGAATAPAATPIAPAAPVATPAPIAEPAPVAAVPPEPVAAAQPTIAPQPAVAAQPATPPAPRAAASAPRAVAASSAPAAKPLAASAQEQTILGWPASQYTIQLLGVSSEKAARDYIAAQTNRADLLLFKSRRQGKDWFVVITGRYPSSAQARQAIASLPAAQREAGPWPRELGAIQQEIRSR